MTPDTPTSRVEREDVARVLEPQAWAAVGVADTLAYLNRRTSSLRKADRILALLRPRSDLEGEVKAALCADVRDLESRLQSAEALIAEMREDHAENFAGKVVMSQATFDELKGAEALVGELRGALEQIGIKPKPMGGPFYGDGDRADYWQALALEYARIARTALGASNVKG